MHVGLYCPPAPLDSLPFPAAHPLPSTAWPSALQIFTSVPRLWNRIYDKVMLAVETGSPLARGLFKRCGRLAIGG